MQIWAIVNRWCAICVLSKVVLCNHSRGDHFEDWPHLINEKWILIDQYISGDQFESRIFNVKRYRSWSTFQISSIIALALQRSTAYYTASLTGFNGPLFLNINEVYFYIGTLMTYILVPLVLFFCYLLGQSPSVQVRLRWMIIRILRYPLITY